MDEYNGEQQVTLSYAMVLDVGQSVTEDRFFQTL